VQVRLIVGALKCVGTGELTVSDGMSLSLSLQSLQLWVWLELNNV